MNTPKHTIHLAELAPQHCANRCSERAAIKAGIETANAEYVDYLKQMINSLLENQMSLSAALDETREACAQLNLQKSELEASSTQEVQVLQAELSMCRQREAEMTLAYEDLRSRVEAIDSVIEQIPWLDVLFNSDDPLPIRLKSLKCGEAEEESGAVESHLSQTSSTLRSVSYDEDDEEAETEGDGEEEDDDEADIDVMDSEITPHHNHRPVPLSVWRHPKRNGSTSPLSDSGCTSESHDEISLASLNSTHSSPHLAVLRGRLEAQQELQHQQNGVRMRRPPQQPSLKRSATTAGGNGVWRLGRITESLRASISKFADKSEWKMEALAARQREARALVLLNETQAEVRKVESRCKGLSRRQNEQELRIGEKEKEIERLLNQERELRRELRNWQQRVFQLEAETQEIRHNCQIEELEMKSRLLEASIIAADPAVKSPLQNPASLFSEDLLRMKATEEVGTSTTPPISSNSQEDPSRLPKFVRRPRYSSTTCLSRLPMVSPSLNKGTLEMSRPLSSLNLDRSTSSSDGAQVRSRGITLTTSFGSLSELELKPDV